MTIHRIAGDGRAHGLVRCASEFAKGKKGHVRIDTHPRNIIMQRQIEKCGFRKCGTIFVTDGTPRIAYQWDRE